MQRWGALTWLCRYLHFSSFNTSLIPYSIHPGPSGEISTSLPLVKGGGFYGASVPSPPVTLTAPLACTAGRTFRRRTFCSRRRRATASPNPLFVASQQYPQQLNVMWYRKECDFKCQQLMNHRGAKILLSRRYPQQRRMYEANEIHTSEMQTEKGCFMASVISASGYTLVTRMKHSEGWSKPKTATESPRHLSQSLLAIYLKGQWEIELHKFPAFFIVFSEFIYYLCWINNTDEKNKNKPEVWSAVNCLEVGPGHWIQGSSFPRPTSDLPWEYDKDLFVVSLQYLAQWGPDPWLEPPGIATVRTNNNS